ncbi:MAG: biopolymer transporter ExbD [Paludibacter sp.]|jgi:biopolymer transport protein ExbD|nr:biopolymer transporter ExbD [Paludibacter sp.]
MAQIRKKGTRETPAMSTTSLPDIIFILLFFFMAVTSMKEVTYKVKVSPPSATEIQKLENKSLVRYIYVGEPMRDFREQYGTSTRIQLNDQFADIADLEQFITLERSAMKEEDQNVMTVSIKADKDTKMGIITDIKQALRRAYALKIVYQAGARKAF